MESPDEGLEGPKKGAGQGFGGALSQEGRQCVVDGGCVTTRVDVPTSSDDEETRPMSSSIAVDNFGGHRCSNGSSDAHATMQTFVAAIAAAVAENSGTSGEAVVPVFVGATGGVRDAMHEKTVSAEDLADKTTIRL